MPRAATARRFEQDVRAALPDRADRILADPAWAALTTTLAHAETAGHNPRRPWPKWAPNESSTAPSTPPRSSTGASYAGHAGACRIVARPTPLGYVEG